MFSNLGRRSAAFSSSSARSVALPRTAATPALSQSFHTTSAQQQQQQQQNATSQPARMPSRRVKTPWIEALNKSREEARAAASGMKSAQHGATQESGKVDLTPKRMGDSFHNVVCVIRGGGGGNGGVFDMVY